MLDPHQRRLALLAAAVAFVLQEQEGAETQESTSLAWSRTGHPHFRSWAFNPRAGTSGWRTAGRLATHRRVGT